MVGYTPELFEQIIIDIDQSLMLVHVFLLFIECKTYTKTTCAHRDIDFMRLHFVLEKRLLNAKYTI